MEHGSYCWCLQVFDCDFERDAVRYEHSGNPLLLDDAILLLVYQFSDAGANVDRLTIPVTVTSPAYEVVLPGDEAGLARLEVDAVEGAVTPSIDSEFLQFRFRLDSDLTAMCLVTYTESTSTQPFPEVGQLVRGRTDDLVRNYTGSCSDFLFQDFKYRFSGTASAGLDYLPLTVELDDGRGRPRLETVYLKVVIRGGELNSAPVLRVNMTQVPVIKQLTSLRLNTEMLSVFDRETNPTHIVINVTSHLDPDEEGFFARTYDHTRPLSSFRYDELMRRRIVFQPPSRPITSELEVRVELVAVDSRFAASSASTLTLIVLPASSSSNLRVLHNRGLVVPEGGSQPITLEDLDVVDASGRRLDNVQLHVKAGMRRGSLEVDGQQKAVFSLYDIERKKVVYHHADSDARDDRIVFRAVTGRHSVRVRFPIFVLSRNDRAPSLAAAGEPLVVPRGGYSQITPRNLDAVDRETSDRRQTVFHVLDRPASGEITKKANPLTSGRRVSTFTQLDVDRGFIYYRHRGGETDRDRIDYRLTDSAHPPNESGRLSLDVLVTPSGNLPPHEMERTERWIVVDESSGAVLGKDRLWYEDVEERSDNVVYTITSQPFYPSELTTADAGRLVFLDGGDDPEASYARLSHEEPLLTFTQADVNEGRVAYVAPRTDIGSTERQCRFIFAVADVNGTAIMDQVVSLFSIVCILWRRQDIRTGRACSRVYSSIVGPQTIWINYYNITLYKGL